MRINIMVGTDSATEAHEIIERLTRKHDTWPERLEKEETKAAAAPVVAAKAAADRPNVSPGASSITKMGSKTKTEVIDIAMSGKPMPEKLVEHAKLLWERGDISFDGKEYYYA